MLKVTVMLKLLLKEEIYLIKIRITIVDNVEGRKELSDSIENIEKSFDIIKKNNKLERWVKI